MHRYRLFDGNMAGQAPKLLKLAFFYAEALNILGFKPALNHISVEKEKPYC